MSVEAGDGDGDGDGDPMASAGVVRKYLFGGYCTLSAGCTYTHRLGTMGPSS
jgi:hypothetical protein